VSAHWTFASQDLPPASQSLRRSGDPAALAESGKLAPFEVEGELGRGGMGAVLEVRYRGRPYALKLLLDDSQRIRKRMAREARILGDLDHPGIVSLRGAGEIGGRVFLLHDLVPGARSLSAAWSGLDLDERVALVGQAVDAVGYAHSCGVLHRDLKPDNVLVDQAGRVRVIDFGLATTADDAGHLTQSGAWLGTIEYMAPEQFSASRDRQIPAVDVWSLGVLLYEALTERVPFSGSTALELAGKIQVQDPVRPSQSNAAVSPAVEAVCLKALAKDPAQRYADARELARALQLARNDSRTVGRRRRAGLALGAAGLVLVGAVGFALSRQGASAPGAVSAAPVEAFPDPHAVLEELGGEALCARARARLEEAPGDLSAERALAVGHSDLAEYELSLSAAERVLSALPHDVLALEASAGALYRMGRYGEAEAYCARAVTVAPQRAAAWVLRALIAYDQGDGRASLKAAARAVELEPDSAQALTARGMAYLDQGRPERALADFEAALVLDYNPHILLNRAIARAGLGRFAEAERDFAALRAHPLFAWKGGFGQAQALLRLDLGRGLEAARALWAEYPQRQEAGLLLAGALGAAGERDAARRVLQRVRDLDPETQEGRVAARRLEERRQ